MADGKSAHSFPVLTRKAIFKKTTLRLPERSQNEHEEKSLIRTAVDEEFHARRVEHSSQLVIGKNVLENYPNHEKQRKQSRYHQHCKLFP